MDKQKENSNSDRDGVRAVLAGDVDEQLEYLIGYLFDEMPEQRIPHMPESTEGRFALFRALVNIREPKPIAERFLQVQDKMLRSVTRAKGIADAADLPACALDDRLVLWRGDMTALRVDAIVNAANSGMLGCFVPGHHCIDNAIHTFAGVQLRLACDAIMQAQHHPEPTAQAKTTPGFNLPAKSIIHTVGPIVHGAPTSQQHDQLARCYRACLGAARKAQCKSIAFCCISTGVFGYPQREAAEIAVDTVRSWLDEQAGEGAGGGGPWVERVVFDVFLEGDLEIYESLLEARA